MKDILLVITGFLAGTAAGMGMGGGTLLIPALTLLFGVAQHDAQGINVAAFLPAAAAALFVHAREGRISFRECMPLILSGAAGALLLSLLAGLLPAGFLRRAFGIFLLFLASARAYGMLAKKKRIHTNRTKPENGKKG